MRHQLCLKSVEQIYRGINAFQIGAPGRGAVLFDPYKPHAPLSEVIVNVTAGGRILKESASLFGYQAERVRP